MTGVMAAKRSSSSLIIMSILSNLGKAGNHNLTILGCGGIPEPFPCFPEKQKV
jgi:hypothetical protein